MSLVIRQVLFGLLVSIITGVFTVSATFLAFPLHKWTDLNSVKIFGMPYFTFTFIVIVGVGCVSGIMLGTYWRGKLKQILQQIDDVIRGQKISFTETESVKQIDDIQKHLLKLELKWKQQTEVSQRIATERAKEREKSLQEVVIQERSRLARELHDSVSQQLFAASMMMSAINETNSPKDDIMKKQLQMVENMIHQSQLEMRALLLHLRPVALKGKSLKEGIEQLLSELIQKVPMAIESKIESFDMDKGVEDQIFRILQESISNTLRHAEANLLRVMLLVREGIVILRVEDDGIGFNIEKVKASSYGLQNMQERAAEVGGTLKIISIENEGTRLEVKIPYIKNEVKAND